MTEHIEAWRCVGCGRIEAPQSCIGVCRDQKIDLVSTENYDAAMRDLEAMHKILSSTRGILSRLAFITPRAGNWESTYRILQQQARAALNDLETTRK